MTSPHASAALAETATLHDQDSQRLARPDLTVIVGGASVAETVAVDPVATEPHVPYHLLPRVTFDGVTYVGGAPVAPRDFASATPR